MPFANKIIYLHDLRRSPRERAQSRKVCGPSRYTVPAVTDSTRGYSGFYMDEDMQMAEGGSFMSLRVSLANSVLGHKRRLHDINGYYCDQYEDQIMIPIIARLPRSRGFLAGWTLGEGMASSLDATIYMGEEEAAVAAHSLTERAAEREREYQESEDADRKEAAEAQEEAELAAGREASKQPAGYEQFAARYHADRKEAAEAQEEAELTSKQHAGYEKHLEAILDNVGLSEILDHLASICGAKAEHILENWQDEQTALKWSDAGETLASFAQWNQIRRVSA